MDKSKEELEVIMRRFEERMTKATPLIVRIKKEHKGKSWSGIEECPVCGGKLRLSHSGYNGHVHGHCMTDDCLNWME